MVILRHPEIVEPEPDFLIDSDGGRVEDFQATFIKMQIEIRELFRKIVLNLLDSAIIGG